jgi:hypothetical protein
MIGVYFFMGKYYNNPEWRDVKDFEGYYEISNDGRLRSCDKFLVSKNGIVLQEIKGKPLKVYSRMGYAYCSLYTDKIKRGKKLSIHRLVMEAFGGGNPLDKPMVNHKNGIKDDNRIENLEWVTQSENMIHSARVLGNVFRGEDSPHHKKVYQYDLGGNLLNIWNGASEASRELMLSQGNISNCCRGLIQSYKSHVYSYTPLDVKWFKDRKFGRNKWRSIQVVKYDNNDNIIEVYSSQREAALKNNIDYRTISALLKKGHGKSRVANCNFMVI